MPVLYILSIIIQVAFVIHVVKTGRNTLWIWVVIMLPLAGSLAYFIVEILPEMTGSRTGRKVQRNLQKIVNPDKNLKEAMNNYSISATVENAIRLAEASLEKGLYAEAKNLYEKSLTGIHEHDPAMMHGLARAEFGLNNCQRCRELLDDLIANNPGYKNAQAHLLYARTLEELGQTKEALHEYEALDRYFSGPEASYRYALLLKKTDQQEKARQVLEEIEKKAKLSDRNYNSLYREWIAAARNELNS